MAKYPFRVAKKKVAVIEATTLDSALDRVLSLHPDKFIQTKYARNVHNHLNTKRMDLVSALEKVKTDSKKAKGIVHYLILDNDEYEVRDFKTVGLKDDIYQVWRDGKKLQDYKEDEKLEAQEAAKELKEKVDKKQNKKRLSEQIMEEAEVIEQKEKTKNTTTKMETKVKSKTKKAAPKKTAVKKDAKLPRGNNMFLTKEQWAKVDAKLEKLGTTFSSFSRGLVLSAVGLKDN